MSGSKHPYRTAKKIEGAKSLDRTDPPLGVGKAICVSQVRYACGVYIPEDQLFYRKELVAKIWST